MNRITGNQVREFAAANYPEPHQPRMGAYGHWDAIAAILTHVLTTRKWFETARVAGSEPMMESNRQQELGLMIALGEIMAIRLQEDPSGSIDDQAHAAIAKANSYLEWARPLMQKPQKAV